MKNLATGAELYLAGRGKSTTLGVAVYVVLIDAWLFRAVVPRSYIEFFHTHDLRQRLIYYMLRAFNENVLYRLFAFSTLGYVLALMSKRRTISFVISMVVAQVVNVGINIFIETGNQTSGEFGAFIVRQRKRLLQELLCSFGHNDILSI